MYDKIFIEFKNKELNMKLLLSSIIIICALVTISFAGNPYGFGYFQTSNPYGQGYVQDKCLFGVC